MKDTDSIHTALKRARIAYPQLLDREGKKTPARRLAFFFNQLFITHVPREEVHDKIRWTGSVPTRGVKGWEAVALRWGRKETD